ncbi:MAG: ShlB/FhaC/HecB family hemolysin secretion/activation protein [Proteobacteria bacterium]|nr:ShlB/FhaC/HecB family hemolysin secretion/activation protein [Pseudomonadota bacterium]
MVLPAPATAQGVGAHVDPTLATGQNLRQPQRRPDDASRLKLETAPASESVTDGTGGVLVGAIRVDGAGPLDQGELMARVAPYIGKVLDRATLGEMLGAVSNVARAHGYVFARSKVPEQAMVGGLLRVQLDLGRIDRIELRGVQSAAVRAVLAPLLGKPAKGDEVERRLMLATDLPGMWIGSVSYSADGGTGVLSVEVSRRKATAHVELDNRGQAELGPLRLAIAYDFGGILGNERLGLTFQTLNTPADPKELQVVSTRLAYVFTNFGTELSLTGTYSHTRSGGALAPFGITGVGRIGEVALSQPLLRRRNASLWLNAALDYYSVDQAITGLRFRRDRQAVLNLSLNGYAPLAGGQLRGGIGLARVLPGGTVAGDPLASRPGAGGDATILSAWANWQGTISGPLSARLALSSQWTDKPLLAVSQMAVGGPQFGRAYDFAERTGDRGVLGSAELDYQLWKSDSGVLRSATVYSFADAGHVVNLANTLGTGDLYSAGVGGRFSLLDHYRIGLEAARPLNTTRLQTGDSSSRLSFTLGADF